MAAFVIAGSAAFWFWYSAELGRPHTIASGSQGADTAIIIPRGAPGTAVSSVLRQAGIDHPTIVYRLEEWRRGGGYNPKAGEFLLPGVASLSQALDIIHEGKAVQHAFTIAEGVTNAAFAAALDADTRFTGVAAPLPAEGGLLPETYFFTRGTARDDFVARVIADREAVVAALWAERQDGLPFSTPAEAVVLASIIERETALASERGLVASVFVNRLRAGMKLQSDPTVLYGLEQDGQKVDTLQRRHLSHDSPWNTYLHRGLPPSPICNPGKDSLRAALNPEASPYYYFVADGNGGHAFARTLGEHNRNVRNWRAIRDSNRGG